MGAAETPHLHDLGICERALSSQNQLRIFIFGDPQIPHLIQEQPKTVLDILIL